MDTLTINSQVAPRNLTIGNALIAGINDIDYYTGMLGVGATQGAFGGKVINPLISQLAESVGAIPSHSYGYTAGASYGKSQICSVHLQTGLVY